MKHYVMLHRKYNITKYYDTHKTIYHTTPQYIDLQRNVKKHFKSHHTTTIYYKNKKHIVYYNPS